MGTSSIRFIRRGGVSRSSSIRELPPPSLTWQTEQFTCRYDLTRASSGALRVVGIDQPGLALFSPAQRAFEHADVLHRA